MTKIINQRKKSSHAAFRSGSDFAQTVRKKGGAVVGSVLTTYPPEEAIEFRPEFYSLYLNDISLAATIHLLPGVLHGSMVVLIDSVVCIGTAYPFDTDALDPAFEARASGRAV